MMTLRTSPIATAILAVLVTALFCGFGISNASAASPSAPPGASPASKSPATGNTAPAPAVNNAPAAASGERGAGDTDATREPVISDETAASRNAARTRMRECGHQWSSMKKSGAANGLTWKDFSQSCLARK